MVNSTSHAIIKYQTTRVCVLFHREFIVTSFCSRFVMISLIPTDKSTSIFLKCDFQSVYIFPATCTVF